MIDITLLGTSALVPLPDRALTAVALTCAGHSILFDCGEGTQAAARKAGVSLMKADLIALTHYHGDHIFGMPGLLQTMCCLGRTETLYITGPAGLKEELSPILKLAGWTSYEIVLLPFPVDGLRLETLAKGWPPEAKLTAFSTEHRVPSQGYCFTLDRAGKFMPEKAKALGVPTNQWGLLQKGQSVQVGEAVIRPDQVLGEPRKGLKFVFTGDTAACPALTCAAADADLLISEATYGENEQGALAVDHGHMNFAQAAETAAKANVKELWLAHYSQMIEDPQEYLPNATAIFSNAICGQDGMGTTLQFEKDR
ncbi:MAG: ribonuclease Z [Clostridia bacterium]|nr:ribonuclease Z [Clostridia bacterium]